MSSVVTGEEEEPETFCVERGERGLLECAGAEERAKEVGCVSGEVGSRRRWVIDEAVGVGEHERAAAGEGPPCSRTTRTR